MFACNIPCLFSVFSPSLEMSCMYTMKSHDVEKAKYRRTRKEKKLIPFHIFLVSHFIHGLPWKASHEKQSYKVLQGPTRSLQGPMRVGGQVMCHDYDRVSCKVTPCNLCVTGKATLRVTLCHVMSLRLSQGQSEWHSATQATLILCSEWPPLV